MGAAGTPSGAWGFKSVFGGLSKTMSSALKKTGSSATSSPGQERRLSASFMGLKPGGTPMALHGKCPSWRERHARKEAQRLASLSFPCHMSRHSITEACALHVGLTPGNFSPSAFFLDGSPSGGNAANLSAVSMSSLSAIAGKAKGILSPPMSDLKEVRPHLSSVFLHHSPNCAQVVCWAAPLLRLGSSGAPLLTGQGIPCGLVALVSLETELP